MAAKKKPKLPENGTEFQALLGKLVRVPKEELEQELKADKRRKRRRKKKIKAEMNRQMAL